MKHLDSTEPRFLTVGTIAAELDVPVHRVAYVLRTRRIAASGRAGCARVYDREAVALIRHALRSIEQNRQRKGGERC